MGLGEVLKTEGKIIETAQAKTDTTITKGQLVTNDGAGFVPATTTLSNTKAAYVALDDVEAAATDRSFRVLIRGVAIAKRATTTTAIVKGTKLIISTTAGQLTPATTATDVVVAESAKDCQIGQDEIAIRI